MSSTLPRPLVTVSTLNNPPSSDTVVASSPPLAAIAPDRRPHLQADENQTPLKRRKISPDMFEPIAVTGRLLNQQRQQQPVPQSPCIPIAALLYHYAQVAHQTSHVHLQQAFVPTHISTDRSSGHSIIKLYSSSSSSLTQQTSSSNRFNHDPQAFTKALGLQLYALDLLRAGLGMNNLSDMERVAFSLEFGVVGIKVYMAQQQILQSKSKGKEKIEGAQVVDCQRLMDDMQDIVGQAVSLCFCRLPASFVGFFFLELTTTDDDGKSSSWLSGSHR